MSQPARLAAYVKLGPCRLPRGGAFRLPCRACGQTQANTLPSPFCLSARAYATGGAARTGGPEAQDTEERAYPHGAGHAWKERESSSSASSSSSSHSAHAQFEQQRKSFHRHSFHEKGSHPGARGDSNHTAGEDSRGEPHPAGASTSATAKERRDMSRNWENAFFGRVHYEDGMHERFREALDAEEHERLANKTNAELFPDWSPDEEAPAHLFRKLSPALQLRYILNRLAMGERRVRYAPDYGSLSMMYQLNLGERMVAEAEDLLRQLGWMNEELEEKIDEVKAVAMKVKYDYDLD